MALCQQWRPQSRAWDSETGLGAHSLEAQDYTHWPGPAQHSTAQPRPAHPSSPQPPPPRGLPAPPPAALFWLQLLGVYVCTLPALSIPPLSLPSLAFFFSGFPPSFSYFLIPVCPFCVSFFFLYPRCVSSSRAKRRVVIVPSNY